MPSTERDLAIQVTNVLSDLLGEAPYGHLAGFHCSERPVDQRPIIEVNGITKPVLSPVDHSVFNLKVHRYHLSQRLMAILVPSEKIQESGIFGLVERVNHGYLLTEHRTEAMLTNEFYISP